MMISSSVKNRRMPEHQVARKRVSQGTEVDDNRRNTKTATRTDAPMHGSKFKFVMVLSKELDLIIGHLFGDSDYY
jgi:hypothetical protein